MLYEVYTIESLGRKLNLADCGAVVSGSSTEERALGKGQMGSALMLKLGAGSSERSSGLLSLHRQDKSFDIFLANGLQRPRSRLGSFPPRAEE